MTAPPNKMSSKADELKEMTFSDWVDFMLWWAESDLPLPQALVNKQRRAK